MLCEHCGESAVTVRDERYYCGRCALRADWEGVALSAQGLAVREALAGDPPPVPPAGPVAEMAPPADPFAT